MPIYLIVGFSPVLGDCWYIEAETPTAAIEIVQREMHDSDPDFDLHPVDQWEVLEVPRPFRLPLFKD